MGGACHFSWSFFDLNVVFNLLNGYHNQLTLAFFVLSFLYSNTPPARAPEPRLCFSYFKRENDCDWRKDAWGWGCGSYIACMPACFHAGEIFIPLRRKQYWATLYDSLLCRLLLHFPADVPFPDRPAAYFGLPPF